VAEILWIALLEKPEADPSPAEAADFTPIVTIHAVIADQPVFQRQDISQVDKGKQWAHLREDVQACRLNSKTI